MINLRKYANDAKEVIVAHRGASGEFPENTLIAIENAVKQQADMVEIDIQITKDNEVIVFHDDYLGRTADGDDKISDVNFDEIINLDIGAWFSEKFRGQTIPYLEEVIDIIDNKAYLLLELKSYKDNNFAKKFQFIKEILYDRNYFHNTLFASFDYNLLNSLKSEFESINTAAIKIPDKIINPLELYNKINNDVFICSTEEYTDSINEIVTQNDLFAGVYGVDDIKTLQSISEYNIKAFGTNYPGLIRKELG